MTKFDIDNAINSAFVCLSDTNEMVYDFWLSELYDEDDNIIEDKWTEDTAVAMNQDVLINSLN